MRIGSGTYFQITERGKVETDRYAELRRNLLVARMREIAHITEKLKAATELMHSMTGSYDTAARETATINRVALYPDADQPAAPRKKRGTT